MRRCLWVTTLIVMLLGSVGPAAAQDAGEEACMLKGGQWDAEQGTCVIGAQIEMTAPYPMELVGMPYVEQAVDDFLAARRAEFLGALIDYGPTPSPGPLVQDMEYTLFEHGETYTSLLYTVYQFMGGAHGSTMYYTFIFDHANARVLSLSDLFTDPAAALAVIAPIAQEAVRTQLNNDIADEDWLALGTEPIEENYQSVILTEDALVFYFQQYQVAAYAAGTFEITVPLTAIADYLAIPVE